MFPVLYPELGWFVAGFSSGFYPQEGLASPAGDRQMEFFGWLKLRTKAATTGISNLAPHESGVNAAEWCSTVDCVEKKAVSVSAF